MVLHSTALCIQPRNILRKWFLTTVLTLPSFNSISQKIPLPVKDWVTLIYFQLKGSLRAEKIDLDDFVDEFDSRHDNRRIKLR